MNYVPAKKRSEDLIDGIIAAVMTEALAMVAPVPNPDWCCCEHAFASHLGAAGSATFAGW